MKNCWSFGSLVKDPQIFANWVAAHLTFSNCERLELLKINSIQLRLLELLRKLVESTSFACASCENTICSKSDIIHVAESYYDDPPESEDGHSYYDNEVYNSTLTEYVTVQKANNTRIDVHALPSMYHGYESRFAYCGRCGIDIGFALKRLDDQVEPDQFFNLSTNNVHLIDETRHSKLTH